MNLTKMAQAYHEASPCILKWTPLSKHKSGQNKIESGLV